MNGPTIVPFTGGNVGDIPNGLRRLADQLEGKLPRESKFGLENVQALVWVSLDAEGNTAFGALGTNVDRYKAVGIAHQAILNSFYSGFRQP